MATPSVYILLCCAQITGQPGEFCHSPETRFYQTEWACQRQQEERRISNPDTQTRHCRCARYGEDTCRKGALGTPHAAVPVRGVPGPIVGAGAPALAALGGLFWFIRRRKS